MFAIRCWQCGRPVHVNDAVRVTVNPEPISGRVDFCSSCYATRQRKQFVVKGAATIVGVVLAFSVYCWIISQRVSQPTIHPTVNGKSAASNSVPLGSVGAGQDYTKNALPSAEWPRDRRKQAQARYNSRPAAPRASSNSSLSQ